MKIRSLSFISRISVIVPTGIAVLLVLGIAEAQEPKKDGPQSRQKGEHSGKKMRLGGDAWSSLSEGEREKLREVLRRVWSDPEVQSAREEVKNAAENYKKAVKAAVGKEDPQVAKLLVKVQSENAGNARQLLPPGPPHPGDGKGGRRVPLLFQIGGAGFLEKLSKEDREKILKAQVVAKERPEVKEALKAMDKIRKKDDEFRKERLQAFMKVRKASYDALIAVDPDLKDIIPRGGPPPQPQRKSPGKRPGTKGPKKDQ